MGHEPLPWRPAEMAVVAGSVQTMQTVQPSLGMATTDRSVTARLGRVQGQRRTARARLSTSHAKTQAELKTVQAELAAVMGQVQMKTPSQETTAQSWTGWEEVRASWARAKAAWERVMAENQAQLQAVSRAHAELQQSLAGTARALLQLTQPHARFAQLREDRAAPAPTAPQPPPLGPVLQAVHEQAVGAVHRILATAVQELGRGQPAPALLQLAAEVHAQAQSALRAILAGAGQGLAKPHQDQVAMAVRDGIVAVEQDWVAPLRAPLPAGS